MPSITRRLESRGASGWDSTWAGPLFSLAGGGGVGLEGHHGLVCRKSQGRSQRHFVINDIMWRALVKAGVPSTKEPLGLFGSDGKRPDGATLVPWSHGRYLAWDATMAHSCAASYIDPRASLGGSAAEQAADRKTLKYAGLHSSFVFQPVAIETLGQYNRSALDFIGEIGNRTSLSTGNKRETSFLFQRLSICIQSFNLVAFKGTFLTTEDGA